MSKTLIVCAVLLTLGAQLAPATLSPPVRIHPEGDHGITTFGPFVAGSIEASQDVVVGAAGELTLAKTDGLYAKVGHVELPVTTPPQAFDTVSLGIDETCDAGCEVFAQVRVVDAATGAASRWQNLQREGEILLARPAASFQVRLVLNSSTGREAPRVRGVMIQAVRRAVETADDTVGPEGNVPMPPLVTRAMWGAKPPKDPYTDHVPYQLTVHHSSSPTQTEYQGAASIRGIQAFHMGPERGWSDIGYHFLVGPDGKLYEGRPATAVGAHSPPNTGKVGVCVIGDFENHELPTDAQRATLVKILAYLAGHYRIPATRIHGHREFQTTDCPGQQLFDQLPAIRKEVADLVAASK